MPYRRFLLIVLVLLWGCSTKKNTWMSRHYHDLTAHYNVFYNGNESYKAGIKAIQESYKDNYTKVLPMFEESDEEAVNTASSNMDRAIEKGTKLIVRHSITARPKKRYGSSSKKDFYNKKEYNKWVDDALLLIGKAQVVKHEFRQAIRTFNLLINDFPNDKNKYNALIWKARAYTELEDFNNARIALESYDLDGKAPESLYGKYMEVYANLLLRQKKYRETQAALRNAIEGSKKRIDKARYSFILAQIEELTGDEDAAAKAYAQALKYRPNYEMAFNAKLRKAAIVYRDASLDEILKQIRKMLRDKKNEEFQDQIYYALGKVYMNFDNEQEALNSFVYSAEVSVSNDYQKALSFLAIADIYFKHEEYKPAYQYYDSTLTVMAEDYKSYDEITERHNTLQLLVEQLDVINREDSLLAIADMNEADRDKFIEEIIANAKLKAEIERKEQRKQGNDMFYGGGGSYQDISSPGGGGGGGGWYFYNVTAKEMGKQEFARRWGNRKLEDNWRRSKKGMVAMNSEVPSEPGEPGEPEDPGMPPGDTTSQQPKENDQTGKSQTQVQGKIPTKQELLSDIPLTDEAYSNAMFTRDISLYEAGMIFLDNLKNYPKAIEMFEACIDSKVIPAEEKEKVYIALYRAYDAQGDRINRLRTLAQLKELFPESKFVQYLEDPDYLQKIQAAEKKVDDEYTVTYAAYLNGDYDNVIAKADMIELKDSANIYLPKYRLIKALSFARKGDADMFRQGLETITSKNQGTEEAELASAFLAQMDEGRTPVKSDKPYQSLLRARVEQMSKPEKKAAPEKADMTGFKYSEQEKHNFIALPPQGADINRIVFNMADFNFSRYLLDDYGIETTRLPDNSPVVLIRGFKNKLEALDYFYAIRENEDRIFLAVDSVKTKLFVISDTNLKFFLSSGQINNYEEFFKEFYLKTVDIKEVPKEMLGKTAADSVMTEKPQNQVTEAAKETGEVNQGAEPKDTTAVVQQSVKQEEAVKAVEETQKQVPATQVEQEVNEEHRPVQKEEQPAEKKQKREPAKQEKEKTKEAAAVAAAETATDTAKAEEPVVIEPKEAAPPPPAWVSDKTSPQEVMVVFAKARIDYKKIERIYTNYTKNNFTKDSLKVEMGDFIEGYKNITISGFKNLEQAKSYKKVIKGNAFLIRDIQRREYYIWIITPQNREILLETKDLKGYDEFFKKEYGK